MSVTIRAPARTDPSTGAPVTSTGDDAALAVVKVETQKKSGFRQHLAKIIYQILTTGEHEDDLKLQVSGGRLVADRNNLHTKAAGKGALAPLKSHTQLTGNDFVLTLGLVDYDEWSDDDVSTAEASDGKEADYSSDEFPLSESPDDSTVPLPLRKVRAVCEPCCCTCPARVSFCLWWWWWWWWWLWGGRFDFARSPARGRVRHG